MEDGGKESVFNEASLKTQRIDRSQRTIAELNTNLLQYNFFVKKWYYEIVISELLNLCQEMKGKMSTNEKTTANWFRETIIETLENYPVHKLRKNNMFNANTHNKIWINKMNWIITRKLIFSLEDFVAEQLETHGWSSPNQDTEELWN